jgi:acyl-CoA reductase-like NAD-dependent aldehyde dehydrogenase
MGPLISKKQRDDLLEQVAEAVEKGARVITGGDALEQDGFFMAPTILADVFLNSRVMQEEVFGPVLPVVSYETIDEAIYVANNTPYGLTASIFGNVDQAQAMSSLIQAGCIVINDVGATSYAMPLIPWRGWKSSGPGGSHGIESLLELSRKQTLTVNWLEQLLPFKKQFWHFDKQQGNRTLGQTLLNTYATESLWDKCKPALLQALWQNRSNKKL